MEHLLRLQQDFEQISETLEDIASQVISENISRYPVFVATPLEIAVGIRIASPDQSGTVYHYHISFLEELVKKGIIDRSKVADFRKTYSDPFRKACILLIQPSRMEFIFLPYDYTPYRESS
jgi:hypothetical protein